MKDIQIPPSLLEATDSRLVIDAIYYVVRVLRNSLRNYPKTSVSTEPSPEAQELAQRAVGEIVAYENREITELDKGRIVEYTNSLENLLRQTYLNNIGSDASRAESILEEMRSKNM